MNKIIFLILFVAPTTWCNIWDILHDWKTKPLASTGCTLTLRRAANTKLDVNEPLVVNEKEKEFFYPTSTDGQTNKLTIPSKTSIAIFCPGTSNEIISKKKNLGTNGLRLTCSEDGNFVVNTKKYLSEDLLDLQCKGRAESTLIPSKDDKFIEICKGKYAADVGFEYYTIFYKLYSVCFDIIWKSPVVSKYVVRKDLLTYDVENRDPKKQFIEDGTCQYDGTLYKYQQKIINTLLGMPETSTTYIKPNYGKGVELTRGHLVPNGGFIYASQKKATYHLINTAPQWYFFNSGNWEAVERGVRNRVAKAKNHFDVYTGVSYEEPAAITLPNTIRPIKLYLQPKKKNQPSPAVPVPRYYWKIVHDPKARQAVVFVGHNNPHEATPKITDFCNKAPITWVSLDTKDKSAGYTEACMYDGKIKQKFSNMPQNLEVEGIIPDPEPDPSTTTASSRLNTYL